MKIKTNEQVASEHKLWCDIQPIFFEEIEDGEEFHRIAEKVIGKISRRSYAS